MYFDSEEQIKEIASRTGAALFVVPDTVKVEIPGALVVKPEEKASITIDQMHEMMDVLKTKQIKDLFIVIRPAEKMGLEAANAFLKSLEEPGDKVHFVLITSEPSALLSTIRSRMAIYVLKVIDDGQIHADEKIKNLAKELMVARGVDLVDVAEKIAKKKEGVREYALSVVGVAIEMLYKSYFLTGKIVFLQKLPKFLTLQDNLARNGHVRLQIVASLL